MLHYLLFHFSGQNLCRMIHQKLIRIFPAKFFFDQLITFSHMIGTVFYSMAVRCNRIHTFCLQHLFTVFLWTLVIALGAGLFGAVCVILLFVLMLWRMMVIANNAKDLYGALLVTGIMSHIAIQVVLNIAVVTNTIPNTGVILPFISYGGTSLVFLMAEMGLALSVSKGIRLDTIE